MSMPFMCGAAPSSLTVPVILPSPAALTLWLRKNAPQETRITADSTAVNLLRFVIENLLTKTAKLLLLCELFQPLLLARWGIGIDRLEVEFFRHLLLFAGLRHERSQIENQIPRLIRLNVVGKRRHRSAVQTGHEDSVDIAIRIAAFRPRSLGKVVGSNWPAEIIGQGRGGGTIGLTEYAVALPALHPGKYVSPGFDAIRGNFRLGRTLDWRSRLFIRPARREMLNPGHQVRALLLSERAPLRHV